MDFFKFLPLIMQAWGLIDTIRQALRNGDSIFELLKAKAPELLAFIEQVGKQLFPTLQAEDLVQAGAQRAFDQQTTQWVQVSLNKLEKAGLVEDGSYGPLTKAAVEAFQKKYGLEVDGWAGKITQAKIQELLVDKIK